MKRLFVKGSYIKVSFLGIFFRISSFWGSQFYLKRRDSNRRTDFRHGNRYVCRYPIVSDPKITCLNSNTKLSKNNFFFLRNVALLYNFSLCVVLFLIILLLISYKSLSVPLLINRRVVVSEVGLFYSWSAINLQESKYSRIGHQL